ncbi:MAG: hypothetical protein ACW99A_23620 [Candidatus Kariarchaeaceae archaeon]
MRLLISISLIILLLPVASAMAACEDLIITEIRANAISFDTGSRAPEGEWFELKNAGDEICTIVGALSGASNSAWKFVEGTGGIGGTPSNHLLPYENVSIDVQPGEAIVFAAYPDRFANIYPDADCRVFNITNNPRLGNTHDFLEIRDSNNDGSNLIDRVEWDFGSSISQNYSIHVLSDGSIVQDIPNPCVCDVDIDVKPGSDPNSINLKSKGVIPVSILTTEVLNATTIDPLSVAFGPEGAEEAHGKGHIEDVDDDGDLDLVLHFRTQETGIECGDTEAVLTGETFGGQAIEGFDSINIVKCK